MFVKANRLQANMSTFDIHIGGATRARMCSSTHVSARQWRLRAQMEGVADIGYCGLKALKWTVGAVRDVERTRHYIPVSK